MFFMRIKLIIIILFTGYITFLYGQEETALDSAVNNITKQLLFFPHEKIYLHTDKPYYITGEKIFFRAFLLDAYSNVPALLSRYVYVELINPVDSVVQRIKIRQDENNMFHGAIKLPEELPQGNYKIRAYTQYMRNQGESSFFSKFVRISDPQILSVNAETDFQFTEDGKVNISLRFIDANSREIVRSQSIILRLNLNRQFTSKPDKDGWFRVKLNIPENETRRALYMEFTNNRQVFRQYIRIPYPEKDFDVSFYPEGGHIIAGQTTSVAFKAINNNGAAIDIKGEIVDSNDNTVVAFSTTYDGMGDFFVNLSPDEHYYAVCSSGDQTLRFDLPEVQVNTYSLKTVIRDNKIWLTINKFDLSDLPELYLLIHYGGFVFYAKAWDSSKDFITFEKSEFPTGISHILLLTKDLQTISERLIFTLSDDNGLADFRTQKETYSRREQIRTEIKLTDEEQHPIKGNFSIAVTNDREVVADTASGIFSGILLRSELKGYIENPEYYFQKENKDAEIAADLLMRTHGWTRYAIPDIIRGDLSFPEIPFEMSQNFTGTVKSGLFSKFAKNFKVTLLSLDAGFFDTTETDENGRFEFRNFEFSDSTKYIVQALNRKDKGKAMTELLVNEESFPETHTPWAESAAQKEDSIPLLLDYVAKADMHYIYENGMRIIQLPEVQIKATVKEKKYKSSLYSVPDYSISEEELEKYGHIDIKTLLYRVPGVMVAGNSISIRGGENPLVVIDDVPFNGEDAMEILDMINFHDIGQLDVLKSASNLAMYGMRGANGVIVIHTKRGEINSTPRQYDNIKQLTPLGYQLPVEFYSPKYDTQESINSQTPDLRTTIYWKPNVLTNDDGKAELDFYSSDDNATYSVIIEGISDDGKLIHYRGNAIIKVE